MTLRSRSNVSMGEAREHLRARWRQPGTIDTLTGGLCLPSVSGNVALGVSADLPSRWRTGAFFAKLSFQKESALLVRKTTCDIMLVVRSLFEDFRALHATLSERVKSDGLTTIHDSRPKKTARCRVFLPSTPWPGPRKKVPLAGGITWASGTQA